MRRVARTLTFTKEEPNGTRMGRTTHVRSGMECCTVTMPDLLRFFFFFSSRRRHTRSLRDWSSDVCSSDLEVRARGERALCVFADGGPGGRGVRRDRGVAHRLWLLRRAGRRARGRAGARGRRSEERRVGKECRSRWWPDDGTEKEKREWASA